LAPSSFSKAHVTPNRWTEQDQRIP